MTNSVGGANKACGMLSAVLVIVGAVGYFSLSRGGWAFYSFAHLGAFGVMGLFGSLAGYLAMRKSRSYWTAFLLGTLLPAVAGIAAVLAFWLPEGGHLYCGGAVCLGIGLIVVVTYLVIRKKQPMQISGISPRQS